MNHDKRQLREDKDISDEIGHLRTHISQHNSVLLLELFLNVFHPTHL